ncbi:MAG: hypothetical protein QOF53_2350 [Nocardioidaceae bacterium]|nr:hypothetical protein [Nocardioidaceae bacterium]
MNVAAMVVGAMLFPLAALGLLLWLAHLEDTLERDVHAAQRKPAPPPILSVPTGAVAPEVADAARIPAQRPVPATEVRRPEVAGSAEGALST